MNTLTHSQATRVVRNGGLVVDLDGRDLCCPTDGIYRIVEDGTSGCLPFVTDKLPHPDYDPAVFARTYPLTLPGPEARTLLMEAPVGMLWGDYSGPHEYKWEDRCAYCFDGTNFVFCESGNIADYTFTPDSLHEIRIRPGWLESQRARFARGEFGDVQPMKETPMSYVINGKLVRFPWTGSGPECVEIWEGMPDGVLEWFHTPTRTWGNGSTPFGEKPDDYRLRLRSDAPKPGDVVDAERAWELVLAGWVMKEKIGIAIFALTGGGIKSDIGILMASFHGSDMTLLRHEPWRCASLATGYVWTGKEAAEALRAGMEGKHAKACTNSYIRHECDDKFRWNDGNGYFPMSFFEQLKSIGDKKMLWALRWPAKETNMTTELDLSTFPKTMTGIEAKTLIMEQPAGLLEGQYADADMSRRHNWGYKRDDGTFDSGMWQWNSDSFTVRVRNAAAAAVKTLSGWEFFAQAKDGEVWQRVGGMKYRRNKNSFEMLGANGWETTWGQDIQTYLDSPFTLVPAAPVSKTLTVQGIELTVYADKATYGEWTVSRGIWETAASVMKLLGPDDSWARDKGALEGAGFRSITATQAGVKVGCKTYRPDDVASIIAAMDEIAEGGER